MSCGIRPGSVDQAQTVPLEAIWLLLAQSGSHRACTAQGQVLRTAQARKREVICAAHVVGAKHRPGSLGQAEKIPDTTVKLFLIQSGLLCATTATWVTFSAQAWHTE